MQVVPWNKVESGSGIACLSFCLEQAMQVHRHVRDVEYGCSRLEDTLQSYLFGKHLRKILQGGSIL